jgi:hypothetical protein
MSQSDYIKRLKLATELTHQTELKPVLDSKSYILYKEYTTVNSVKNTVQLHNELPLPEITKIFDMPIYVSNECQMFNMDKNTDQRVNRVLNTYSSPSPVSRYKKHRINNLCHPSCYDPSINGIYKRKCNFFNSNFTPYANYRLREMRCNCKEI